MGKSSRAPALESNLKNGKKKKKSGPESVAMKVQAPKSNPFETIWSRRKFDILGKKRKGEERRVGLARSRAIEKVTNSLDHFVNFHTNLICYLGFYWVLFLIEEEDIVERVRAG